MFTVKLTCGGLQIFNIDTVENPFSNRSLIEQDIIEKFARNEVYAAFLLTASVLGLQKAEDLNRFNKTVYAMSLGLKGYRILMQYRIGCCGTRVIRIICRLST